MTNENNQPVTRADLKAMEDRLIKAMQEFVRDAQTELLRGFARYSEGAPSACAAWKPTLATPTSSFTKGWKS
ncbi:MAG: hypothetical protein JJE04_13390 [Acidobacteriia bacterium]|nr:hypothetical protein [Terriglobia bacterium]